MAAEEVDSYPEIGGQDADRRHLVTSEGGTVGVANGDGGRGGFFARHRWCLIISCSILLISIGHALAIYFIYFHCDTAIGNCAAIK